MSIGGHSLHKKDYLGLAALLGLGATGAGAAGIGPLASMFGTVAGPAAIDTTLAPEMAGPLELGGSTAAANPASIAAGNFWSTSVAPGLANKALPGLLSGASRLTQQMQPQPMPPMGRPGLSAGPAPPVTLPYGLPTGAPASSLPSMGMGPNYSNSMGLGQTGTMGPGMGSMGQGQIPPDVLAWLRQQGYNV